LLVFHSGQTFENATPKKSFWKWLRLLYFEWTAWSNLAIDRGPATWIWRSGNPGFHGQR
jgi:hypothetical protein